MGPLLQHAWCPYKKTAIWRQRIGMTLRQGKERQRLPAEHQKLEEARNNSPTGFWASTALPIPWFWTSGPQNCETINFCCFKPPSLWYYVMAALVNWHKCRMFIRNQYLWKEGGGGKTGQRERNWSVMQAWQNFNWFSRELRREYCPPQGCSVSGWNGQDLLNLRI